MKTLLKFSLLASGLLIGTQGRAQSKIDSTAKKVGHKTSEIAAKGASDVVDKKYKSKVGSGGQTIYINKYSHYYYVNKLGHRVYVKKSELRDK